MKRLLKKIFSKVTFIILLCILALLIFFFWGWIEKQFLKVRGIYYIYKGDQAYSQDNMAKTLEYYDKGLTFYPEHYEAWFNLGNIYAVYEDYYAAVDAYEHAIKYNPKFVMARMNLGIIYSEDLGFFDEAIEQFDTITKISIFKLWIPFVYSNIKSVNGNRGIAYYNKGVAFRKKALYLKKGSVKNFCIVDAGMNDLIRPALYNSWMNIVEVKKHQDAPVELYDVVGPVCESDDFLGKERKLVVRAGEYLAVRGAGAYGSSMSSNYNSHPLCAEILVDKDKSYVIRKRQDFSQMWENEIIAGL